MQKLIHRNLIIVILLFLFEILGAAALFFIADNGYFDEIINDILTGALFIIILFNLVLVLIVFNRISNARQKTDISSLSVIGGDVEEAYDFGKIGLIVTDDNGEVVWTNKLFADVQYKLMDHPIEELDAKLSAFRNQDKKIDELKITIDSRNYLVRYLDKANLYIFKDITETEELVKYSVDHAPAIGIITIDNYQDMANILDDVSINDNLVSIQRIIIEYSRRYNLLLKKYKNDSYLFICNHSDYERIVNDKLSLLQQIREGDHELTLSIGLSSGIDNYSRLFELASTALDVALSRGGNQAVIANHGENYIFVGGQTEARAKRNTVQIRTMANSLRAAIEDMSTIYIMGHATADFDAIGAALGTYCLATSLNKKAKIVYDEESVETATKKAFKKLFSKEQINEMTISPSKALDDFNSKSLLLLVDVNSIQISMCPSLVKKADLEKQIAIIDHHRAGGNALKHSKAKFGFVDPSASSACELIAEMIHYGNVSVKISPEIATFMLAGIILDTRSYKVRIGAKTYDASYVLKNFGADNLLAYSFFKEEYEEYALKIKIKNNFITPHYGVIVSWADNKEIVEQAILAKVANETLNVSEVNICFVFGKISDKTIGLSVRTDGTVSGQLLCEKLGGGGSYSEAAAKFEGLSIEEVKNRILDTLDSYLNDAKDAIKKKAGN